MIIHYGVQPSTIYHHAVITIGTFDGVHNGHKKIIEQLVHTAKQQQGTSVIVTFDPHPRNIVGDTSGVKLLTTLPEKLQLLEKMEVDVVVVVPFDNHFANLTAEAYIEDFLYKNFKPHTVIIGYDHQFGQGRKGNYSLLEQYGHKLGFWVKEISPQLLQQAAVSSTRIRKALLQQETTTANSLLGYTYSFEGKVIEGDKIGRTIGYPTANLQLLHEDKLVPGDGVYAVKIYYNQTYFNGMMYIGSRPVVNGKRRVIEVNIFDFNEDIYNKNITILVCNYLRGEVPMNSLEDLQNQLAIDKLNCIKILE